MFDFIVPHLKKCMWAKASGKDVGRLLLKWFKVIFISGTKIVLFF